MRQRRFTPLILTAALLLVPVAQGLAFDMGQGISRTSLRLAWSDSDENQDKRSAFFSQYYRAEGGSADEWGRFFLGGSYKYDLGNEQSESLFYEQSSERDFYLYEAGVNAALGDLSEFTAGRFDWESAERVQIDGLAVSVGDRYQLRGFAGRSVSYFSDLEDDELWGVGIRADLPLGMDLRADYMNLFEGIVDAELRGGIGHWGSARIGGQAVDNDLRELYARGDLWFEQTGTHLRGGYFKKLGNEEDADYGFDFTTDADATSQQIDRINLEREAPYNQYEASVEQLALDTLSVGLRYVKRDLIDEDHYESASNTSFDVITARLSWDGAALLKGLYLDGYYSYWKEERLNGHEAGSSSWSVAVTEKLSDLWSMWLFYYNKTEDVNNQLENQLAELAQLGVEYADPDDWAVTAELSHEADDVIEELYGVEAIIRFDTRLTVRF